MLTAFKKIQKEKGAEPTEFEESVGQVSVGSMLLNVVLFNENSQVNLLSSVTAFQALFDLENINNELKSDLKDLFINSAV